MNRRWVRLAGHLALIGLVWMGTLVPAVASAPKITVVYVYTNPEGTPLARADDDDGNIIARYDYKPYGAPVAPVPGQLPAGPGYTGHVNDPGTGLVYMQQRYYDPIGRFLSPDPVGPTPGNVFNFNRYNYANNNPIRYTDPDGRCVGAPKDKNAPCNPEPTLPPPPRPQPKPEVSPTVQRMRDTANCGGCIGPSVQAYQQAAAIAAISAYYSAMVNWATSWNFSIGIAGTAALAPSQVSVEGGVALDTSGKVCGYITVCGGGVATVPPVWASAGFTPTIGRGMLPQNSSLTTLGPIWYGGRHLWGQGQL